MKGFRVETLDLGFGFKVLGGSKNCGPVLNAL